MKFVDEATVEVQAGKGGAGASHFRREKFVPRGGPDGGDGGNGGSVVVEATHSKRTLLDFRFRPQWKAKNGGAGGTNQRNGKNGEDIILQVPVGTEIFRTSASDKQELVADLSEDGTRYTIAKGGKGGKGNTFFKSATNQAPREAQPGIEGEAGSFILSLKLLADVGLVGLPNAGKSTFLSRVSAANPKIGDYPFTTKEPQLGIVKGPSGKTCVVADIPGLIEGAHHGKGLGLQFLKHIERTSLLLHLLDVSPLLLDEGVETLRREFETIETELREFSETVHAKPRLLALTKVDTLPEDFPIEEKIQEAFPNPIGSEYCLISSVSGAGMEPCLAKIFSMLDSFSQN